jgi:hypothetical protein
MPLLSSALDYILGIITENEEVKKFPKDFVTASMLWIRTWFLTDDPKTETKLNDPDRSLESKKTILESKLEDLQDNPQFMSELQDKLNALAHQRERLKNVVTDTDIDVKGNVHIGDSGTSSGDHYDQKNVVKGSNIKAGGDFRLGDDVNTTINHITHNYSGNPSAHGKSPTISSLKAELQQLIRQAKTGMAIERFLDASEKIDADLHAEILQLSGQFNYMERKERMGTASTSEINLERNKINSALVELMGKLD